VRSLRFVEFSVLLPCPDITTKQDKTQDKRKGIHLAITLTNACRFWIFF
jgi:hypothetical protein